MQEDWAQFMDAVNSRYDLDGTPPEPENFSAPAPKKKQKKRSRLLPILLALLVLAAAAGGGFALLRGSQKITDGVQVSGLSLGGMSRSEAAQAIRDVFDPGTHDLALELPGRTLTLSQAETGVTLDTQGLLTDALTLVNPGELSLAPYLHLNEAALRNLLEQTAQELRSSYQDTHYRLEGETPDLSEADPPDAAALPTLVVTLGIPSYEMDVDAAAEAIFTGLSEGQFQVDLTGTLTALAPAEMDAEAIIQDVSLPAQNARMDITSKTAIPAVYGLTCDQAKLEALLKDAQPGQTVRLAMELEAPEIMGQEVYFQDVLGFCETPHSTSEKRNANLILACAALNGVVLQPGEVLSYNATLGERTEEAGYQKAPAYSGTKLIDTLGGGICQVSSTLYLSSLYAELETVERVSHGYPSNYMPIGLDATVSWGSPDLKIKNSTDFPVKIIAETTEEYVRVWIMGTEARDYYVRMAFSSSKDGYARSYFCRYDRETDELISKDDCALSSYLAVNTPARGEIGSNEVYVNGNVRQQPDCAPSEEIRKAAENDQQPNTRG